MWKCTAFSPREPQTLHTDGGCYFYFVGVGAIRKKAGRLCVARASRACARNRPTKDGADSGDDDDEEKSKPLRECLSAEVNSFFSTLCMGVCVCSCLYVF